MPTIADRVVRHLLLNHPRLVLAGNRLIAGMRYRLPSERVDQMHENLAVAFPERSAAERRDLARRCVEDIRQDGIHQYRLELLPRARLLGEIGAVELRGSGYLEQAYADARPVIFVTAHYGAYMLAALKAALEFPRRKMNFFYNPTERNPYAATSDALLALVNESCGILHTSPKGVVAAVKCLLRGESLCIVADQVTPDGEVAFVPFFGRFYAAMQGVAYFAQRSDARILPAFGRTDAAGRTILEFLPPIERAEIGGGEGEEQLYRTTCAVFRSFEGYIRHAPTHWKYWTSFKRCSLGSPHPPVSCEDARNQIAGMERTLAHDRPLIADRHIWNAAARMFVAPG